MQLIARASSGMILLVLLAAPVIAAESIPDRPKAEHVVLVVWDGMRPDFVKEEYAPNLTKLAQSGVVFRNHHSIYPSLTSVNAAALATGVYPSRSGMIANWVFLPQIRGGKLARMDGPETIEKADQMTGGKYLAVPTIAELVRAAGGRTAIAGTKTAALVHDRKPAHERNGSVTISDGKTVPEEALDSIVKTVGAFPEADEVPNAAQDNWTTRALTEALWSDGLPRFSVLWMSEPDRSQHATAPGTKESLAAIRSSDANLGLLISALEAKGVRDKTDILIASDHGFSTIARSVDVPAVLREQGFNVATEKDETLASGQIRVAGNGGTNLYYVGEHDAATAARLVEVLQQSDFASVIFSRTALPGTFPLEETQVAGGSGPDVVMSFRWEARTNQRGVTGMIAANGSGDAYKGTHGTLSPFDLHNTFIAAGPSFRSRMQSELPTANTDVAATIMQILGVNPPERLDGRVVAEAMIGSDLPPGSVKQETIAASREFPTGIWRQELKTSKVGSTIYIDEGSGRFEPK
jgi:arylsulfatase A-like enzyme